ncbi:hypothetical protein [Massilia sp. IC2-476]|uniref:hypothetical protein n=1 Tax=Massilia sp. IC2-476 TaxID=2887199 RepID=UPI001D0FB899|nr:hypothetical protein [Massilia sp. IC2-476]MCC2974701.1 hypothetical protein [Massilia sp. IC2-476]
MQIPDAAIGSIVAAAIAGLVVFISTVLTKEQKTSEFRQVWIDELRKDVSHYIASTIEIATLYSYKKKKGDNDLKFLEDNLKVIQELQAIEYRILLRLNPKEHGNLISKLKDFRTDILALDPANASSKKMEATLTDALTQDCKDILKSEWERVKKGEPAFRIVKFAAIIIAGILGLLSIFYMLSGSVAPAASSEKATAKLAASVEATCDNLAPANTNNQTVQLFLETPKSNFAPPSGSNKVLPKPKQNDRTPLQSVTRNCESKISDSK